MAKLKADTRPGLTPADILRRHHALLNWHISRCGADCCPGNDMRLAVCGPSPSIRKLEHFWPAPQTKAGELKPEVCSSCYHRAECHVGVEVYKELL